MSEQLPAVDFDAQLSRLRDSCLLYLKLDFAIIAAVATAASVFKLNGHDLLSFAVSYREIVNWLISLISYGLALEFFLTWFRNRNRISVATETEASEDRQFGVITVRIMTFGYAIQAIGHVMALAYCSGMVSEHLDFLSTHSGH